MSGRLRGALAAVALLAIVTPRSARAVCNAGGGCPDVVATCCGATSCTLDGTITVTDDVCVLNFGSRDVALSGEIAAGPHSVTIVAGSVHLTGRLSAAGGRGIVTIAAAPGGMLGRPGMPGFSLTERGRIDLSGSNGSTLAIDADGAVELRGGQGSLVSAKATDPGGAGGTIDITSRSDSITIGMPVSLDGGDSGIGGTLRLTAAKSLTFTPSAAPVSAAGGFEGGTLDFEGAESVAFNVGSNVQAIGAPLTGGSGGTIDVGGGTIDVEGILDASGGTGGVGGVGGDGGFVSIEARHGPLMVMRRSGGVGITVDGAPGGDSGEVDLSTDSPVSGTITVAAQMSAAAQGNTTLTAGSGGTIGVDAAAKLTLNANLDVSALTGDAGEIDLNENDNDIDVVVNAKLDVSAATGGGVLSIGNSHDVEFTPGASVNINAVGSLTGGGPGGEVTLSARRDVLFDAGAAGLSLNASGSGTFPGGSITAIAGRNLTVGRGASLHADGGGPSGAIRLRAGRDATDSQWTGNVTVDGQVTATGNGAQPVALSCTDRDDRGCSIVLDGCQVTVSGGVDSTDAGHAPTANLLIGRKSITVTGALRSTRPEGANAAYSSTTPQTTGATVNPALGPCPGGCVLLPCTSRDPTSAAFMPDGCLVPCPTCGNGAVEFPEQCDDGNTNECDACDPHCRLPAHATCEDNNVCTSDDCDPTFGCRNEPLADGTGCDDGNLCTTADMCRGGACLGGPTAVCDDQNVCTLDSCEAATGCRHDAINCDDHDACTVGPDTCDPQTGCHHGALKTCDVGQVCQSPGGECVQKPCSPNGPNTACADGNPCTTDVCENGLCRNAPVADATPCDNTDRCDGRETCQAGVCVPGVAPPLDCDDQDPCTIDRACDPAAGCTGHNDRVPGCTRCQPGDACDDANPCTIDRCLPEGVCGHDNKPDCCTVDQDCADRLCMRKSCDRPSGSCQYEATVGVACGGGCQGPEIAVLSGTCDARGECCDADGVCPPQVVACESDDDPCTDDVCEAANGCVHRPVSLSLCCHNVGECDDHNGCTTDTCTDSGCRNDLVSSDCIPCSADTDCGGRCLGRACISGVCADVAPFTCPKLGTACRLEAGQPVCRCSDSRGCDDGNKCNGTETCVTATGTCVAGTALHCDDGNVCTDDTCDPTVGCVFTDARGFAGVSRQLIAVDGAVGGAGAGDLAPSLAKVLRAKTSAIRAKLRAAQAASGSAKRQGRMLKAASKSLNGLNTTIGKARRGRKPKISASLADTLAARLGCAATAVQGLQAAATP